MLSGVGSGKDDENEGFAGKAGWQGQLLLPVRDKGHVASASLPDLTDVWRAIGHMSWAAPF